MKKSKISSTYRLTKETRDQIKMLADYKQWSEAEVVKAAIENEISWCKTNLKGFKEFIDQ